MKHQQLAVLVFLAVISVCSGHIGGSLISLQNVDPQVYCGRNLARALAFLCYGESDKKRSESGTMYNAVLSPYYKDQEIGYPWLEPHRAMGLGSRSKRFPGIVNECCEKPCSLNELFNYC